MISLSNMFVLYLNALWFQNFVYSETMFDFILSNSELSMLIDDLCVNYTVPYVTSENYYI